MNQPATKTDFIFLLTLLLVLNERLVTLALVILCATFFVGWEACEYLRQTKSIRLESEIIAQQIIARNDWWITEFYLVRQSWLYPAGPYWIALIESTADDGWIDQPQTCEHGPFIEFTPELLRDEKWYALFLHLQALYCEETNEFSQCKVWFALSEIEHRPNNHWFHLTPGLDGLDTRIAHWPPELLLANN